jgi:hypothetical protein
VTLAEYMEEVRQMKAAIHTWRLGQTYFNILYAERPDLSERVRGTGLDPFYSDAVVPEFLTWLGANWDSPS